MKKDLAIKLTALVLLALLILTVGCSRTQITRFYTLTSLTDPRTDGGADSPAQGIAVGLGPIELPEYLDRPQIVTRVSSNEVRFADFERWAGPLEDDLAGTLAANLSGLLRTDRIALYPWKGTTPIDCRVEIQVSRFDGKPGDHVSLQGKWSVLSRDRKQTFVTKASIVREPTNGKGYEALVAAQSRAVATLSREIAEAIRNLPQGAPEE
jgi:uncharacterized lipoprotein YmbA